MLFAAACPRVLIVDEGYTYSKYVFVSDRDKGLSQSLTTDNDIPKKPCYKLCPSHQRDFENKVWS